MCMFCICQCFTALEFSIQMGHNAEKVYNSQHVHDKKRFLQIFAFKKLSPSFYGWGV